MAQVRRRTLHGHVRTRRRRSSSRWIAAGVAVLLGPSPSSAQQGPPPTVPGTAVLYRGPVQADTLPILCAVAGQPRAGFVTEMGSAEWAPSLDLRVFRFAGVPATDSLGMTFEDGGTVYERSLQMADSGEGPLTVAVNLIPWDQGRGVDLYFTADCSTRLPRGKKR